MPKLQKKDYLVIVGPTASGKSALAMQLAKDLQGEIINCDSVQLYQGFDIGSAKPSREDQELIPHHLIDCVAAVQPFDARAFAETAEAVIQNIQKRQRLPIIVGGNGLYLRALWRENWHDLPKNEELRVELGRLSNTGLLERLEGLDPHRAAQLHQNDRFRLLRAVEIVTLLGGPMSSLEAPESLRASAYTVRVRCPRPQLLSRIEQRVEAMLASGLIEEVKLLLARGVSPDCKPMQSIGYAEVNRYLQGAISRAQLPENMIIATRQYAKRQETWFNKQVFDAQWSTQDEEMTLLAELHKIWP